MNALCKCDASATRANQFRSFLLAAITQNVCQLESLSAECPRDAVMVVTSARYGRMRLSRCAHHDFGHLGCHSDVRLLLERKCSGRRRCALPVPNADLEATRPCHSDLKSYLELVFVCVSGTTICFLFPPISDDERTCQHPVFRCSRVALQQLRGKRRNSLAQRRNPLQRCRRHFRLRPRGVAMETGH